MSGSEFWPLLSLFIYSFCTTISATNVLYPTFKTIHSNTVDFNCSLLFSADVILIGQKIGFDSIMPPVQDGDIVHLVALIAPPRHAQ